MMNLYLSNGDKVTDTIYMTSNGQPVFTVQTPWSMMSKRIVISRGGDVIAKIRWKKSGSPTIEFGNREVKAKNFFRKGKSRGEQIFTGPDGNEYKWTKVKKGKLELVHNSKLHETVAKFHPKYSGLFRKKQKALLEVMAAGQHMVEVILITFVFIETARRSSRKELLELELEGLIDLADGDGGGGGGGDGGSWSWGGDGGGGGGGGDGGGGGGGGSS